MCSACGEVIISLVLGLLWQLFGTVYSVSFFSMRGLEAFIDSRKSTLVQILCRTFFVASLATTLPISQTIFRSLSGSQQVACSHSSSFGFFTSHSVLSDLTS